MGPRRAAVPEAAAPDLDTGFPALWEGCKDELAARISAAFLGGGTWRDGMRAAAWALCRWLQENPVRGRVVFVDVCFAAEVVRASRDQVFTAYAELIHLAAGEHPGPPVAREYADAIMGAIWHRASGAVRAGAFDSLPGLVPQLMYTVVLPYCGDAAAREELRRGAEDIARYERGEI